MHGSFWLRSKDGGAGLYMHATTGTLPSPVGIGM